jgi:glycosyltransferase involved in cell wall biosynthesis
MSERIRVLHVRCSVVIGGPETTLLAWFNHYDKTRYGFTLALFNNGGKEKTFRDVCARDGVSTTELSWVPGRNILRAVRELVQMIRDTGAQILHTHDWRSDVVGLLAARKAGIPIVTTIYVWFNRPFKVWLMEKIDGFVIRYFDYVTAVSRATLEQTFQRGVKRDRGGLLISGMSNERFRGSVDRDAVRGRFGIAPDEIVYTYAARLYPEKAHDILVDAFHKAAREQPNIRLLILGVGPLEEAIRAQIRNLGAGDRIHMPGFVKEIPDVLRSVDVMVHASYAEGIALAIYEGMLAGLPVIGSNVDGTPEVVLPGKTGWIVPPGDSESLRKAILEAATRPDLREIYGRQARELIETQYNMDVALDQLYAVYDRLLRSRET